MTERPDDLEPETTTGEDEPAPAAEGGAPEPATTPGGDMPEEAETADVPPAPEESPATAPDRSAPPVQAPASRARTGTGGTARSAETGEPVLVRAHAKYVRTSARKARLVVDNIRGKRVTEARSILAFTPRAAAKPWLKLLESAVANAEHNHELVGDDLRIHAVFADEGPTLKRFQPRAMGRATRIRKRTSHLTIILTPDVSSGTRRGARRKGGR